MIDEYVLKKYMEKIVFMFDSKIAKDTSVEIDHDTNFPDRENYISINFYYKNSLIFSESYDLCCLVESNSYFKIKEDVEKFKESLKNRIFQQYYENIQDVEGEK